MSLLLTGVALPPQPLPGPHQPWLQASIAVRRRRGWSARRKRGGQKAERVGGQRGCSLALQLACGRTSGVTRAPGAPGPALGSVCSDVALGPMVQPGVRSGASLASRLHGLHTRSPSGPLHTSRLCSQHRPAPRKGLQLGIQGNKDRAQQHQIEKCPKGHLRERSTQHFREAGSGNGQPEWEGSFTPRFCAPLFCINSLL